MTATAQHAPWSTARETGAFISIQLSF